MDEKEMIWRMRNSYRAGKSREDITRSMLSKGYRLEYINLLHEKARGVLQKKVFIGSVIISLLLLLFISSGYIVYDILDTPTIDKKEILSNPLLGKRLTFDKKPSDFSDNSSQSMSITGNVVISDPEDVVYASEVFITPEFISYLLNELGAWKLQPNPLTGSLPVMNFYIDDAEFYAVVDDSKVSSFKGSNENPDVSFYTTKDIVLEAMVDSEPENLFRDSFGEGKSTIELEKSDATLFAKGYLSLYQSLSS